MSSASGAIGIAGRLASHALASSSRAAAHAAPLWACALQRRGAASAADKEAGGGDGSGAAAPPTLTPEQRAALPHVLSLLQRPGATAMRLADLTGLAVTHRDLSLVFTNLHLRQQGFLEPLTVTDTEYAHAMAMGAATAAATAATTTSPDAITPAADAVLAAADRPPARAAAPGEAPLGTYVPLVDVTAIPDHLSVDGATPAPLEPHLDARHMDRITCWAATQPGHVEMSHQLLTGVNLFPPTEAAYPTYVDFDAATRALAQRRSRKRLRLARRLLRKRDKYQLATWDHYPGEA